MQSRRVSEVHEGPPEAAVPPATTAFPCLTGAFLWTRVKKSPKNPISVLQGKPGGAREWPVTDPPISVTRRAQPGEPVPGCPAGACTTVARTVAARATASPSRYPPAGRPSCRARPLLAGRVPARIDRGCGPGVKAAPAPGRADLTGRAEWRLDACGPGRQASPTPPAGTRAGRHCPRQRRGSARGHRPGPPRARPCQSFPPAGTGRPPAPHRSAPAGPPLSPVPRAGRPGQPTAVAPAGRT
jgi:hypothetical protein